MIPNAARNLNVIILIQEFETRLKSSQNLQNVVYE